MLWVLLGKESMYVSHTTMLIAATALIGTQAGFNSPGPPPTQAAPVPTLEQAKSFIESMSRDYGAISCTMSETSTMESSVSFKIDGSSFFIDERSTTRHQDPETPTADEKRETYKFRIDEVNFVTGQENNPGSYPQCFKPSYIEFTCTNSPCITYTRNVISTNISSAPYRFNSTSTRLGDRLYLRDRDAADRIKKAAQFYKDNLKYVLQSPF